MRLTVRPTFLCLVCFATCLMVRAQEDDPEIPRAPVPRLPATAANAAAFAPRGWKVQVQASGDLNGDGRPDLAFVLHEVNPKLILHPKDFGTDNLDTNPRVLGIAFAMPDGTYTLVAQNSELIPRWTEPNMDDYFGEEGSLTITRGAFTVGLHYFANMGGWDAGSTSLTFRWQHGRFEMIGYENDNLKRNTGEETKTSINFSTGVKIVSYDSINEDGAKPRPPRRTKLPPKALRTLDDIGSGFDYQEP